MVWRDRALISLALKEDLEADEGVDLQDPDAIDATVTGTTGDRHFLEVRLAKEALAEALEPWG